MYFYCATVTLHTWRLCLYMDMESHSQLTIQIYASEEGF